jgi:predicted RNase H-like HicB family nuclease
MNVFTAIVEKDFDTNLYVGYVLGFPGAHSQGETLDELQSNLCEVIEMLLEDERKVRINSFDIQMDAQRLFLSIKDMIFHLAYCGRLQPILT